MTRGFDIFFRGILGGRVCLSVWVGVSVGKERTREETYLGKFDGVGHDVGRESSIL
jgi:hypothetical protein